MINVGWHAVLPSPSRLYIYTTGILYIVGMCNVLEVYTHSPNSGLEKAQRGEIDTDSGNTPLQALCVYEKERERHNKRFNAVQITCQAHVQTHTNTRTGVM